MRHIVVCYMITHMVYSVQQLSVLWSTRNILTTSYKEFVDIIAIIVKKLNYHKYSKRSEVTWWFIVNYIKSMPHKFMPMPKICATKSIFRLQHHSQHNHRGICYFRLPKQTCHTIWYELYLDHITKQKLRLSWVG